jgi:hypothetical protein
VRVESVVAEGLLDRRLPTEAGAYKTLVDLRLRASHRLERWCSQLGLTPASKAAIVAAVTGGRTLAVELREQRAQLEVVN